MKQALLLQTQGISNEALADLVNYSVQLKGCAYISPLDINVRSITDNWNLVYVDEEYWLHTNEEVASLMNDCSITTCKSNLQFFEVLHCGEFKYL